jgi:hypothetical protein
VSSFFIVTALEFLNFLFVYFTQEDQHMALQIATTMWNSMKGRPVLVLYFCFENFYNSIQEGV